MLFLVFAVLKNDISEPELLVLEHKKICCSSKNIFQSIGHA